MKPLCPLLLLTVIFCSILGYEASGETERKYFGWEPTEASFTGDAIGRAYGHAGNTLLAIGGRTPSGELLDEVQVLEKSATGYTRHIARLSQPIAFAATAVHEGKTYVVGGIGSTGLSNRVIALEWVNGTLVETLLPPLDTPLLLPGVAIHRSTTRYFLTVIGGTSSIESPVARDTMYEISLTELVSGNPVTWSTLPPLPQGGRIAPMAREAFNEIVVLGGYITDAEGELTATDDNRAYARTARDGQSKPGWKTRAPLPQPLARAAIAGMGSAHIVVVGGDSAGGTLAGLLDGTKPVNALDDVWSFHDLTDTWHLIGSPTQAGADGYLAVIDDSTCLWLDARDAGGQTIPAATMNFLNTTKKIGGFDWSVIALYFIGIAAVGAWFARGKKDASTYALGGQEMKWWATAISMAAGNISTISFMAIPALVAGMGLVANSTAIFIFATMFFSAWITFPLLRRLKITSTYAYLEQRFGVTLRLIGSFQSIITQMMGRIGIVVMLPALAISTMTGISPVFSILAMGLFTTIYSSAGGFKAVIWTDVIQCMLMFGGFILIGVLAFINIKGGGAAFMEYGREMERFNVFITEFDLTLPMMWFPLMTLIFATMSFANDQSVAQRVLATPMKDLRKFAYLQGFISVGVAALSAVVGLSLFAFFKSQPEFLSPVMKNDQLVPLFLVNKVPVGLAGLLLATLFAAAMSTISSSVNACAVMFAEDFYKRFFKNATDRSETRVMQIGTLVAGCLGTGMALWLLSLPMPTIWETFMRVMALLGGGFGGIFILGMFTRRTHELGAVIGVVASCFVAYFLQFSNLDIHWSGLGLLITLSCIVVGYLSSLIIPWQRKDLTGLTVWDQIKDRVTDEELLAQKTPVETTAVR